MTQGEKHTDDCAVAITNDVGGPNTAGVEKGERLGYSIVVGIGTANVGRTPVPRTLETQNPVGAGQNRTERT